MKKLIELIATLAELVSESSKLDRIEAETRAQIEKAIATGNLEDETAMRKMSDARLRLDMVPSRRKQLNQRLQQARAELRPAMQSASSRWSKFVLQKRDAKFDEFIAAVARFFDSERAARRHFESEHIPAVHELSRCHCDEYHPDPNPSEKLDMAERFIKTVRRNCKANDWPEFE